MNRAASFLSIFLLSSFLLQSQTIYLKYDANCMNRLEYTNPKDPVPFVGYSFFLGNQQLVILDVGKEGNAVVKEIKEKLTSCQDFVLDKTQVRNINSGLARVVIVKEKPGFFEMNPVNQAGFVGHAANTLEVISPETEFVLFTDTPVSGQNLAKPDSRYEVFLKGIAPAQCASSFSFEFKEAAQSSSYHSFTVVPGLGFLEKRKVSSAGFFTDESTNTVSLNTINGFQFRDYLTIFCDQRQAEYYEGKQVTQPSVYSELITSKSSVDSSAAIGGDPCAPSTVSGVHIVQKGETMYGIARRYGISLEQLREWNRLQGTDVISICQTLMVKQTSATTATTSPTSITSPSQPSITWISAPSIHVVRPGETVAMLANLYGFTEERFRRMNSLSSTENLNIGQKLHTSDCICPDYQAVPNTPDPKLVSKAGEQPADANAEMYFKPIKVHVVQQDDTLFSIAQKYNTTTERILELNGLKKSDAIKLNQRLYVQ